MATAVESPFSTLGTTPATQTTQSNTQEVIDVDLFDDDDIQIVDMRRSQSRPVAGPSRASGVSTPETISLVDDSDDDEIFMPPSSSTRRGQRRRLFSPPPPRQHTRSPASNPPPVPRVPSQYASQISFAPRFAQLAAHRNLPPPPPPVQAVDQNFNFNFGRDTPPAAGPSRRQAQPAPAAPRAASRSRHVPSMGLGGAIITNNRARVAAERRNVVGPAPAWGHTSLLANTMDAAFRGIPGTMRRIYPGLGALFGGADLDAMNEDEDFEEAMDAIHAQGRFRQPLKEKEHYKVLYTHPVPATPGFTHDFAPSDEPTDDATAKLFPPTSSSEPILIMDDDELPSSSSASGAGSGSASKQASAQAQQESQEGKMTTLLVCARCQDPLILNSGLVGADTYNRKIWALRCGHMLDGKCLTEIGQPAVVVDRKGKGKAKEEIPYGEDPVAFAARASSIKEEASNEEASEDAHAHTSPSGSKNRKRKRAPAKTSSSKKAKVEAEFEWTCPVPNCGQTHVSVKVHGGWGPEKERRLLKKDTLAKLPEDYVARGPIQVFA